MKKPVGFESFEVKADSTLIDFLMLCFPGKSRTSTKQLLQHGNVKVNGKLCSKATEKLVAGNKVEVGKYSTGKIQKPQSLPDMPILYEDDWLIVVNKPSGLLTMGTEKDKVNTAYRMISDYLKDIRPDYKVFIVHRLDRDTSGILVFARSTKVRDILQKRWHTEHHKREYTALVSGVPQQKNGTVESWLTENANFQVFSNPQHGNGQHAITHWELEEHSKNYSILRVKPETGRRNQIRVHMSDIGHPIVGDRRYGQGDNPIGRLGLHAEMLEFEHPITHKTMHFEARAEKDFYRVVRK